MEKLYEATIKDAETNEVIAKVSAFSQEGLEEEMGKTKWTKFAGGKPKKLEVDDQHEPSEEDWHILDQDEDRFSRKNE